MHLVRNIYIYIYTVKINIHKLQNKINQQKQSDMIDVSKITKDHRINKRLKFRVIQFH